MLSMFDVCIDARMAFSSGIGTYIREIIPLLKHSFRIILLVDKLDRDWCRGFDQIAFKAPIYSIKEQLLYGVKIPHCDLFWSPHYNVPLFPIRARKRVVTVHDVCHLVFGSLPKRAYARFFMGNALKSDRVITVSHFSKREIEKRLGKGCLRVIPIGVNLDRFTPRNPCNLVRKKYNLPKKFALFIGSQKPHKNLGGLLSAFKRSDLELIALGNGIWSIDEPDLPVLYSMAEIFVFPSFYEGFGLPPLEAMACACPTVVSNAASIPEVCGDASVYFDPSNEDEIVNGVQNALKRKNELIEKGLERVKLFSWKTSAEKHLQVLNEAARA